MSGTQHVVDLTFEQGAASGIMSRPFLNPVTMRPDLTLAASVWLAQTASAAWDVTAYVERVETPHNLGARYVEMARFTFLDPNDALLFKLHWC